MLKKTIITSAIIFAWTLACIYGTYDNTVKSAEIHATATGYEVTYHNTGHTYEYTK